MRRRAPSCKKWRRITKLRIASRKEHKNPSVFWSSKRLEKQRGSKHHKDSTPLAVLMLFFTEIFLLLVEQRNLYYQQHLDRQARPSRRLPDITFSDMTIIALALQMGHIVKNTA